MPIRTLLTPSLDVFPAEYLIPVHAFHRIFAYDPVGIAHGLLSLGEVVLFRPPVVEPADIRPAQFRHDRGCREGVDGSGWGGGKFWGAREEGEC